jgi:dihydropteroate synthase
MNTISLMNGAHILRVHDVKAAMEAIRLTSLYHQEKEFMKKRMKKIRY